MVFCLCRLRLTKTKIFYLVQPFLANLPNSMIKLSDSSSQVNFFIFFPFLRTSDSCVMVVVFTKWIEFLFCLILHFFFGKIFAGTYFQFECFNCLQLVLIFNLYFVFSFFLEKEREKEIARQKILSQSTVMVDHLCRNAVGFLMIFFFLVEFLFKFLKFLNKIFKISFL